MKVTNIGNKIINLDKDTRILPMESVEVNDRLYNALSSYEAVGLIKISKKAEKPVEDPQEAPEEEMATEVEDVKVDAVEEAQEAPEKPKKGKKK